MKTTIKKRIEEINSGIVPEGYEKTSFGIFPCDWKITRIKSIAYLNKQKFNPQENKDNLVCIELEHIVPERGVLNGNTYAQNKHSLKYTFCKGDILFGKLRPYLGKYYHADQKGVCSTEIWVIRNNNTIDNNFLFQLVKGKRFIQSAQDSAFGTKMPRAEWQKVEKEKFVIPTSFREQSRIAEILMQWDKAIELQEKLIEAYQKSKKYYLNKMFPKKGSKIPEIRFPGFTTPWEQRKVENIADIMGGNAWKSQDYDEFGDYLVITIANVKGDISIDDTIGNKIKSSASNPYVLKTGDILISLTGNVGRVSKMTKIQAVLNQRVGKVKFKNKEVEPSFAFHLLHNPRFESSMIEAGQGAAQKNISNKDVLNYGIKIPIHNLEQQKISTIFDSIDNLITLHQQKRDKLVAQRKAMQQYLLTGIVRV